MKFKLPKSINILGIKIKVKIVDSVEFMGLWDYSANTILLSSHQTKDQMEESFWHEIRHCIQYLTALNQAMPRELLEVDAEMQSRIMPKLVRKVYGK